MSSKVITGCAIFTEHASLRGIDRGRDLCVRCRIERRLHDDPYHEDKAYEQGGLEQKLYDNYKDTGKLQVRHSKKYFNKVDAFAEDISYEERKKLYEEGFYMGFDSDTHNKLRPLAKVARDYTQQECEERQDAFDQKGVSMYGREGFKKYDGHVRKLENLRNESVALGVFHDQHTIQKFDPNNEGTTFYGDSAPLYRNWAKDDSKAVKDPKYFPSGGRGDGHYVQSGFRDEAENAPYFWGDAFGAPVTNEQHGKEYLGRGPAAQRERDRRQGPSGGPSTHHGY
ncbi:hypothetical protein TWF694_005491 [Orbilia ellipsospora]|uniref:Uncharacterized protein n=1 Tax=Orbilia ellipsospora TaxID=2528407 RepID=A0AAV9WT93_9PEZI